MTFRKKDVGVRWRNILKSDGLYLCDLKRVYYKNVNFVSLKIQIILIRSLIFQSKLDIGEWIFYIKITDDTVRNKDDLDNSIKPKKIFITLFKYALFRTG